MKKKALQWGVSFLSLMVMLVGTATIRLPSYMIFYQPKVPAALRHSK